MIGRYDTVNQARDIDDEGIVEATDVAGKPAF
jgi:hypothetical protein